MKRRKPVDEDNGFADHGGYMSAKVSKLEEQFSTIQAACRQKSKIFENISIFVNGHTKPSAEELKRIMMEHSGTFHHYQRSHTKFVIASNLPDVKVRTNITKNIVKPEWIVDSLKENRLLDYSKYLLYTNKNKSQPTIQFKKTEKSEPAVEDVGEEIDVIALSLKALNAKLNIKCDDSSKSSETEVKDPPSPPTAFGKHEGTGTAVDANFLQDFLNNSRLHHIATLGSGFKYYINDLRKKHNGQFPSREQLKGKLKASETIPEAKQEEIVMHIDMDCFFVSVSLKKHPHLIGQPVAVTHSKGNSSLKSGDNFNSFSEIASCSYEAREKGLKNGMFVGAALKLCPELKTIPYDFEEYKKTAFALYDKISQYTLDIEAVSCDELYADLRSLVNECRIDVIELITMLRKEIFEETGCTCSVGLGKNRLQARMATKQAKPNGQFSLLNADVEAYMKDIPIKDLPGVGPNTSHHLNQLKLETCGQLQNLPAQILQQTFGKKFGDTLQMMSRGVDEKKLVFEQVRKSVSVEVNYGIRFNEDHEVQTFLKQVAEELSKRLKEIGKKGKLLTLKLMVRAKDASIETAKFMGHGMADKSSKSIALMSSTDDSIMILNNVLKLLTSFNVPPHELRGIGVQMSKLDEDKKESRLIEMFKKAAEKPSTSNTSRPKIEAEKFDLPTIKPQKSSPLKKRGRPSKFANANKSSTVTSVSDMFHSKKNTQAYFKRTVEKLDPEVLAELPPELVDEILKEYQIPEEGGVEEESNGSSMTNEVPNKKESSEDNVFLKEGWRSSLHFLLETEDEASLLNIIQDAAQLVRLKELDVLYIAMRFLHRIITDEDKERSKAFYNKLAAAIQIEMLKVFSSKLSIPKEFNVPGELLES